MTDFWGKFDLTRMRERSVGYSMEDIEHTLSTVGVECNTQVSVIQYLPCGSRFLLTSRACRITIILGKRQPNVNRSLAALPTLSFSASCGPYYSLD